MEDCEAEFGFCLSFTTRVEQVEVFLPFKRGEFLSIRRKFRNDGLI
jgi:hypothetical protein